MKVICFSETSVNLYHGTRRHVFSSTVVRCGVLCYVQTNLGNDILFQQCGHTLGTAQCANYINRLCLNRKPSIPFWVPDVSHPLYTIGSASMAPSAACQSAFLLQELRNRITMMHIQCLMCLNPTSVVSLQVSGWGSTDVCSVICDNENPK